MRFRTFLCLALIIGGAFFIRESIPQTSAHMMSMQPASRDVSQIGQLQWQIDRSVIKRIHGVFFTPGPEDKGFEKQSLDDGGVVLKSVPQGHLLDRMGMRSGDEILSINEKRPVELKGLGGVLFFLSNPKTIKVVGRRGGEVMTFMYQVTELHLNRQEVGQAQAPVNYLNPFFYLSGIFKFVFAS